jgi:hypothetical protein
MTDLIFIKMEENFNNYNTSTFSDMPNSQAEFTISQEDDNCDSTSINSLKGEVWKDLEQYDGYYAISNFGRLKRYARLDSIGRKLQEKIIVRAYSYTKENYIIGAKFTFGYNNLVLSKSASILLAEAFIGNIPKGHCVVHLDKNIKNDKLENLAIMSYTDSLKLDYSLNKRDNSDFGIKGNIGRNKIVEQYSADGKLIAEFNSLGEVRRLFGYRKSIISRVCLKNFSSKDYSAYGYKWAFQAN